MSQQYSYLQRYLDRVSGNTRNDPYMVAASANSQGMATGVGNATEWFEKAWRNKQLSANAVSWYRPSDDYVYLTEVDDGLPHYDHRVMNAISYSKGKQTLRTANAGGEVSKTDVDKAIYGAFEPEWQDKMVEYNEAQMKTAGAITSKDYQSITTTIVQGELLDLDRRQYVLDQAVSTIRTDELEFEIDTYNRFQVAENVAELELTPERAGQFTTQVFSLAKDQGHIAWTQTFNQRTRRQPVLQIHARNLSDDFDRVINERIATVLQGFTDQPIAANSEWDVINSTHGNSDNNPITDLVTAATTIRNNGGRANTIASNNKSYQAYAQNSFVRGANSPASGLTVGEGVFTNPPLLTGYNWYVDETLPDDIAISYDRAGVIHIIGPRRTANYSKPELELSGIVINNFDQSAIRTAGFGRKISNILA